MQRIILLFILVFLIFGSGICFAQSTAELDSQDLPESDVQDISESEEFLLKPSQPEEKIVKSIEVKGNKHISTNTIVSKMKTRIGAPYQENVISDDLKRLYLLGYFDDIQIDTEDYKEGIKVIVTVVERPIIEEVTFSGRRRIIMGEKKLIDELKTKKGQFLDYPNLASDVSMLEKMYEKAGYSQALIEYQVDVDETTHKAKVNFKITEGKKIRIKNVLVRGNESFSTRRILRLMKTKRAWLLNAGILKDDVFKEDIQRIKSFYQREGFTDVEVSHEIKPHPKNPHWLYITIYINEGKRYLVGNITIQGNEDISNTEILNRLKQAVPGEVFSQEALTEDISNIQGLYFDRGYISARVIESTSLNPYTGRIDIVYNILENEIAYVDKIRIRGNVKTKDMVIRRELRIHPGDAFDGEKLRRSKERLQNLGFFEEVSYDVQESAELNKKDLIVEVKESKTGAFSFGGGYSTVDEFVGFVEIEQKNFDWKNFPYFTGAGQDLRLRASFGTVSSGFDLSFTEPWIFDYPISFGFDLYRRTHERESDVGYGYDQEITGGDLRLGKEISEYLRGNLMYRYDKIEISNVTENASADLMREVGENVISSLTTSLTFDSRDNVFDPSKGNLLSGSMELAGGPFAGDKDFWKFFGRASQYFPLFKGSTLELRVRAGLTDAYGDSDLVPIYERFFAGGAYSIRGYEERGIGPIDPASKDPLGGESLLVGNVEYTYPVLDFLKLAAFYDSGNVWSNLNDIGSSGFKSSVGLGLRVRTPIGPVMLDYGIPLNKAPGEDEKSGGRFHFSIRHGF